MQVDPELLSEIPMFASLSISEREQLASVMRAVTVSDGERLFERGAPGDSMYVIGDGVIRISIEAEDALGQTEEITLAELGMGEFFGELALLDGQPRSACATSVSPRTTLFELDRDTFVDWVRRRPDTAIEMLSALSERIRHADKLLRERAAYNVNDEIERNERVADRIADAFARFGGSWTFIISYVVFVAFWVVLNTIRMTDTGTAFDGPPYDILNFLLALLAALQAPIIMMSQNRDAERDRVRSDADFKVNLKNELGIEKMLQVMEDIQRFERSQRHTMRRQWEMLEGLSAFVEGGGGGQAPAVTGGKPGKPARPAKQTKQAKPGERGKRGDNS